MYHLTCPSCQDQTESPFIRNGAVVRCAACNTKYRIRSANFERKVRTGPRTLDETDTVLRSDSVDIEPDQIAPVSIDDEGNVVGLSGLSELMRWTDEQTSVESETDAKRRQAKPRPTHGISDDLPQAKPAQPQLEPSAQTSASRRKRSRTTKRTKKQKQRQKQKRDMLIGGAALLLIVAGAVTTIALLQTPASSNIQTSTASTPKSIGDQDHPANDHEPNIDPKTPSNDSPHAPVGDPLDNKPSPNPAIKFQAPWLVEDTSLPPGDTPTLRTAAAALTHEGWYISNPPRRAAEALTDQPIRFAQLKGTDPSDGQTLLLGTATNSNSHAAIRGELHIMLLNSTGSIFAETYIPIALIPPNGKHAIAAPIASRYWEQSNEIRAEAKAIQWADDTSSLMQGIRLISTGQGPSTTLRLTAQNLADQAIQGVTIRLTANNDAGHAIANFLIKKEDLFIRPNHWLNLAIAAPLPDDKAAASWSAVVLPN